MGDRTGIDIDTDKQFLESITNAETVFLVEPQRQELDEQLWDERGWDILFFAGHGETTNKTGRIFISENESLEIEQFKNGRWTKIAFYLKNLNFLTSQ